MRMAAAAQAAPARAPRPLAAPGPALARERHGRRRRIMAGDAALGIAARHPGRRRPAVASGGWRLAATGGGEGVAARGGGGARAAFQVTGAFLSPSPGVTLTLPCLSGGARPDYYAVSCEVCGATAGPRI
jgi:hypothetical protein